MRLLSVIAAGIAAVVVLSTRTSAQTVDSETVYRVAGDSDYHRAECPVIKGKQAVPQSFFIQGPGNRPCPVCKPQPRPAKPQLRPMHLSDPGLVFESGSPADVRGDDRAFSLQRTGRVRSRRMYDDFAIEFEFRVHDDVSAAAVELRTAIQNGVARSRGYVLWLTGGNAGKVVAPDGGQVRSWPEVPAFTPPADRWHSARITCEGTHVSVLLDDEPERLFGVAPTAAPIVLFAEGGPVDFRKIVVREMEPAKRERLLPAGVYAPTDAEIPRVVREVKPNYTPAAMQRKVQGVVQLEAVVLPDGSVGEVYVTKQLDPDLDYEAVAAVKKWRFIPGMRAGKPVPVLVTIELTFSLRGR